MVMTREGEDDLSDPGAVNAKVQDLQRRVQLIHEKKPDCVISIHQNSYPDAAVKGAQVFYYTDSKEGEKLALCMQLHWSRGSIRRITGKPRETKRITC